MATRTSTIQNDKTASTPRSGRLALAFQEPLTAILRIGTAKSSDFREWVKKEIENSAEQVQRDGYSGDDADHAKFALVAFLDEAARYSENASLVNWKSVQAELYNSEDAGEMFFAHLKDVQRRGNTGETADLLEVYALCLLLGFEGKYRLGRWTDTSTKHRSIPPLLSAVTAQILKIRQSDELPKPWKLSSGPSTTPTADPWLKRLALASVLLTVFVALLYVSYKASLRSGLNEAQITLTNSAR